MSNQKDPKDFLYEGERLDDLQRDGMYIIQNPKWFCFGMDAVLLSAYAKVKEGEKCLDLGCGNGIIPLLLSGRTKGSSFTGLELQNDIAEMISGKPLHFLKLLPLTLLQVIRRI